MQGLVSTEAIIAPQMIDEGRKKAQGRRRRFLRHGQKLTAAPFHTPLRAHKWKDTDDTFEGILGVIRKGVEGTAMVSHPGGISDSLAVRVAAYVYLVSIDQTKP